MTSRRIVTRLATASAVVAMVGMLSHSLLGYLHLALVPHVRCGHDTMRHLAADSDAASVRTTAAKHAPTIATKTAPRATADVCSVCATVRQSAVQRRAPLCSAGLARQSNVVARSLQAVSASRIFRTAPKQSPPA